MISFLLKYGIYIATFLAVIPFVILSFFNYPVGMHDWEWAVNMVGETDHLSYWEAQKYWYNNTMGRYASTALLSLTYFWFSITLFKWFAFCQLLFLFCSLHLFIRTLFYNKSRSFCLQSSLIILTIYLHGMQSVFEGFYLMCSNVTYQMSASLSLLFFVAYMKKNKKLNSNNFFWRTIAVVLIIAIVGMNEMSMLILAAILTVIVALRFFENRYLDKSDLLLLGVLFIAVFVEISAPGNYTRMTYYPGSKNLSLAIGLAFSSSVFLYIKWLTSSLLIPITFLYLGISSQIPTKHQGLFNFPKLATILLFIIPMGCLFPLFWSMGMETLPDRVVDTLFLFFVLVWFITIKSWFELFRKNELITSFLIPKFLQFGLVTFIIFNLFFSGIDLNKDKAILSTNTSNKLFKLFTVQSNVGNAWKDLVSGDAYGYHQEQLDMLEIVKQNNRDVLLLNKLRHKPLTIYSEKYDRRASYGDKFIGHFFGHKCVIKYTE